MSENDFVEALATLGLQSGDDPEVVRQAYHELKSLYAENSLATYTLLDEEERSTLLERIEAAYRRIMQGEVPTPKSPSDQYATPSSEEIATHPGLYLKRSRERAGMSLREIADRTNIGVRRLQHIEDEQMSQLPAPVFLRGFVTQFAEAVGVTDAEGVAQAYLDRLRDNS